MSVGELDVDPYADVDGRVDRRVARELGTMVASTLSSPAAWEAPGDGFVDRIVTAVGPPARVDEPAGDARAAEVVEEIDAPGPPRRVRPAVIGVVAALVVLFGGIVLLSAVSGNPRSADVSAELVPTGLVADVSGSIEVTSQPSGLEIELDAPSLPRRAAGEFYVGVLRLDDGSLLPLGSFNEGDRVSLWAGVELDRAVELSITLAGTLDGTLDDGADRVVLKYDFPER